MSRPSVLPTPCEEVRRPEPAPEPGAGLEKQSMPQAVARPRTASFRRGFGRLADPKISLASMGAIFLGACAAARAGPIDVLWLALTALGIFFIEVAKNAQGEIVDYDSGADVAVEAVDRSPFSGGKRVLVDALLTRRETAGIAAAGYVLALASGLGIVLGREPRVLWICLAGLACAYSYHGSPLRLSYRGLGELAVALCYGPLIAAGTYLVQRGYLGREVLLPAVSYGLLVGGFLLVNEFPDFKADRRAGKRTLVVRLGRRRASLLFTAVALAAFALVALLPLWGFPRAVWLGMAGAAPALGAGFTLRRHPEETPRLVPAQRRVLLAFVLLALGTGLGMVLGQEGGR